MTDDAAKNRADPIHRLHQRAKLATMGRGFWGTWRPEDISFLLAVYCLLPALLIELSIWFDDWPDHLFGLRVSGSVAGLVLLLALAHGWLIDRFLASMTPGESALPKGVRGLRLAIALVPVFGVHAFTFWKGYLERWTSKHGPLASRSRELVLDLTRPDRLAVGALLQRLYRSSGFFFGMALGILPIILWAAWLMSTPFFGSHRRAVIQGSCAVLHLAACALMIISCRHHLRKSHVTGRQRALYRILPFLWLLPAPGGFAGLALYARLFNPRETLVWTLYARRTGTGRMPLWQSLQGSLRLRWQDRPWFWQWRQPAGLFRETREGRADQQVMAFYRLKTLLLVLEGAAFFGAVSILAKEFPDLRGVSNRVVRSVMFGAITLAGIGLLLQTVVLLMRRLKIPGLSDNRVLQPQTRYLLLTQAAFVAGLQGAAIVAEGQIVQFGMLLSLGGALCAVLTVFFTLPGTRIGDLLLWTALFFSLTLLGILIGIEEQGSQQSLQALEWLTALSPLWGFGLFLAFGGWLLRPFSWRHVFDRRLSGRFRLALGFTMASAALPLGGLAIPFWIYVRQRLLPRHERSALSP